MKKIIVLFLICLITIINFGCVSPFIKYKHPSEQKYSTWVSDDGNISFCVEGESYPVYGTMKTNDGNIDILISMSAQAPSIISVFPADSSVEDISEDRYIEDWWVEEYHKDSFIVVVNDGTNYEEGTQITFYRVK